MANELEVRFSCEDAFRSDVDDIIKVYEAGRHVEKIQRWRQTLEDALFLSLSVCLSVCLSVSCQVTYPLSFPVVGLE